MEANMILDAKLESLLLDEYNLLNRMEQVRLAKIAIGLNL
jgi:hypothetical protein